MKKKYGKGFCSKKNAIQFKAKLKDINLKSREHTANQAPQ